MAKLIVFLAFATASLFGPAVKIVKADLNRIIKKNIETNVIKSGRIIFIRVEIEVIFAGAKLVGFISIAKTIKRF